MKPSEVLETYDWCQGNLAEDKNGCSVGVFDSEAVKFCLVGAVCKALRNRGAISFLDRARVAFDKKNRNLELDEWNDVAGRTKDEVIAFLKEVEDEAK